MRLPHTVLCRPMLAPLKISPWISSTSMEANPSLRILFLTLEFSAATFSGNGIYAQSQVRALSSLGYSVFVICGRPAEHDGTGVDKQGAAELMQVPLSRWGRLDASAPFDELASLGSSDAIASAVASFRPDVAMAVDWSSLDLYRSLAAKLRNHVPPVVPPMVFLNYRVFSRTAAPGPDLERVSRMEREAMAEAALAVALSRSDAEYLERLAAGEAGPTAGDSRPAGVGSGDGEGHGGGGGSRGRQRVEVLLPALREDMRSLPTALPSSVLALAGGDGSSGDGGACAAAAAAAPPAAGEAEEASSSAAEAEAEAEADFAASRPYLTCCVRLSPEKEPERYVELVEELARRGALAVAGVTPLMTGSATDAYAEGLKARLRAAAPNARILEAFVGPSELADVFRGTRLNVHPATYDAYGMTIVEAASQGAPSLVHGGHGYTPGASSDGSGAVGAAADLLSASAGEVVLADLAAGVQALADRVQALLAGAGGLARVAARGAGKARSWSEAANAGALVALVRQRVLAPVRVQGEEQASAAAP